MKIIKDYSIELYGTAGVYRAYVVESATNWYVSLFRSGYMYPVRLNIKVSKRNVATAESAAINTMHDYEHSL